MKSLKEYIESDSLNEVKVDGINIPDSIEDKVSMFKSCIEKLKKDCRVYAQVEASKKEIQFARKLYDMIVSEKLPNGKLDFDAIIPSLLDTCLPDIMIGLVVVLVLSASMSTLSSLVLTSSSTLTLDFIKDLFVKDMDEK